jgi:hypothetical protein
MVSKAAMGFDPGEIARLQTLSLAATNPRIAPFSTATPDFNSYSELSVTRDAERENIAL